MKNFFSIIFVLSLNYIFSYAKIDYKEQTLRQCKTDEYFDITALRCISCPTNQTSIPSYQYSCKCKPGYRTVFENDKICLKCPENHTSSESGMHCVPCAENQNYNSETHLCQECEGENAITLQDFSNLSYFMRCVQCPNNLIADPIENKCVPCHFSFYKASHGSCKCPEGSHKIIHGICALKTDLASIPERKSSFIVSLNGDEFESQLLHKFYKISAYSCNFLKDSTACQLLANLCVLLHYSFDNELNICSFYRVAFGNKMNSIPSHVPVLYYDSGSSDKILFNSSFEAKFNFKGNYSDLKLLVARFSLEGRILLIEPLEHAFNFCFELFPKTDKIKFGSSYHAVCKLPAHFVLNNFKTEFYELFLSYIVGDKEILYPIPVLNENFKHNSNLDKNKWHFTRRFFVIDVDSGRPQYSEKKNYLPKYIQYAESIQVFIQLQEHSSSGSVYPPYMKIKYKKIKVEDLQANNNLKIYFKIAYLIDYKKVLMLFSITIGILCFFSIILGTINAWGLSKRSGIPSVNIVVIFHFGCILCGYIANSVFFTTFFICSIWVVIFKYQDVMWIFLPSESQEVIIKQFVIIAFSLKIVHVMYILYNQITIDLFLVDWEQPKTQGFNHSVRGISHCRSVQKRQNNFVSIWRTYFIANKWSELQTHRKVNVPLILFVMIFYLKVLDYEHFSKLSITPNLPPDFVPFSFIIRFCLSVFLFIMGSFTQTLLKVTIYERYVENKLQMFTDLCSMANISVLILQHHLYGFYIHGRSVYGEADLDMRSLYDQLKREEEDLCQRRGLEPSTECQTFELRITSKFRSSYDAILQVLKDTIQTIPRNKMPTYKRIEHCIEAHEQMKKFLTIFLQHGLKGLDFIVKEKFFLENFLDLEFHEPKEKSLFFRDHCHSFDKVLLCGKESVFLTFEVMVFTFVDAFSSNFILASAVTYIVHKIIKTMRYQGGKRNMINKTLVDERFLI